MLFRDLAQVTQFGDRMSANRSKMRGGRARKPLVEALEGRALMTASLTWLGPIPGAGSFNPGGINLNDEIAGTDNKSPARGSYVWNVATGYTKDAIPPSFYDFSLTLIDSAGNTAGVYDNPNQGIPIGIRYGGGHYQLLGGSTVDGTHVNGINSSGDLVGSNGQFATFWKNDDISAGGFDPLTDLGLGQGSNATAINDMGMIVGTYLFSGGQTPFIYQGGLHLNLPELSGTMGDIPIAINNNGWIVGKAGGLGVLWKPDPNTGAYVASGLDFVPVGINDNNIVAGNTDVTGAKGVLWSQASGDVDPNTLLPPGTASVLTSISSINKNNDIDGVGTQGPYLLTGVTLSASPVSSVFVNASGIHKLLYADQDLSVQVSIDNQRDSEVQGQETFYLSTNQNTSVQGDTQLDTNGNVSLDLQPGQTQYLPQVPSILTVNIPSDIQPGTYYLKAAFQESANSKTYPAAVSPALSVCVNSAGQASSFANDPQNAAIFDNAVDVVKQGNPPIPVINSANFDQATERFIQGWEGLSLKVYNDNGNPAIGFGSDLENSDGVVNATFKSIINAYLAQNPQIPFTFQDYLNYNSGATINKATAIALFNSGYQTARSYVESNYSGLTFGQEAALIDIAYNIGGAGLAAFTSMNDDIDLGTPYRFACAGLELINSKRTSQIPLARTLAEFYLLTSAPGVADQL